MKTTLLILSLLCISFANALDKKDAIHEDSLNTYISNLQIGDTVSYKTFLTSCLSGNRYETMDSICFYRDSTGLTAVYHNYLYPIEPDTLKKINLIEIKMLSIGLGITKTSFYNYIIDFQNEQGLIGFGERHKWDELVQAVTRN